MTSLAGRRIGGVGLLGRRASAAHLRDLCGRYPYFEVRLFRSIPVLLAFMMSRNFKKLEGEKAAIGLQSNGTASLMIDDPLQVGECFFEKTLRLTKTELQEIVYQLAEGQLRRRLEAALAGDRWEINSSAVRFAITNGSAVSGVRLVKGLHVRLR